MRPKRFFQFVILSMVLALLPLTNLEANGKTSMSSAITIAPEITVARTRVTPDTVSTLDVLTIGTTLANADRRTDNLYVEMKVVNEDGQEVLRTAQRGVGIDEGSNQSVYWVWRIPDRIVPGVYAVQIAVFGPEHTSPYVVKKDAGGFQVLERQ